MMKRFWMAAALAAAVLCGGEAMAAPQPGLMDGAAQVAVTTEGSFEKFDAKLPVWKGGTALQRARVNAALERERLRFENQLAEHGAHGEVTGWLSWLAGRTDGGVVSLVLLESTYFKGAAHPMTQVIGMNFDENGERITRKDALAHAAVTDAADINAAIEAQAAERKLPLFPAEWRTVAEWPEQFYIGADGHLYFLFQQYEIAPYAAGWIAIDAGAWQDAQ